MIENTLAAVHLGINLPAGTSASTLLHKLMQETASTQPDLALWTREFGGAELDKERLAASVISFEALRAGSDRRLEIAESLVRGSRSVLTFNPLDGKPLFLVEVMTQKARPLPTVFKSLGNSPGLLPRVPHPGRHRRQTDPNQWISSMVSEHKITEAAGEALGWFVGKDVINLSKHKFVIMGAGAELAPTELLLEGGAKVLWIDTGGPEKFLATTALEAGTLVYPTYGANLLTQPAEIAATIEEFADGDPVHIGAFAYAGGNALEWRLTAAMNAIVRALDPHIAASLGLYISPTTPAMVEKEDILHVEQYKFGLLDFMMREIGLLDDNHITVGDRTWAQSIVPLQGGSYLAAQYIEKRLAAEVLAVRGLRGQPMTVSANVAGISRTRSMDTAIFQAGFAGASSLGLEIYDPMTTRWLSGLMYLHDILNPNQQLFRHDDRADDLFRQQIHGGVFSHHYAIKELLRVAALIGFLKKPWLIGRALFRKSSL